jgi:hypothetical protein
MLDKNVLLRFQRPDSQRTNVIGASKMHVLGDQIVRSTEHTVAETKD